MNHIETTAYRAVVAAMTGAAFRQVTIPFQFPVEFLRDFPTEPDTAMKENLGRLTHPLFDTYGLNVEISALRSQESPRVTVVARFW